MKFEKRFKIRDRKFTERDIRTIWQYVSHQRNSSAKGCASIIVVNDGETVSSDDDAVFETTNFRRKDIKRVEMRYHSEDFTSKISVTIEGADAISFFSNNYIEISGSSEEWVEACSAKLHDILYCVEKVSWFNRMYCSCGHYVVPGLFVVLFWEVFMELIIPMIKQLNILPVIKISIALAVLAVGGCCFWQIGKLSSFFPSVVIDINGQKENLRRRIYAVLLWCTGSILLPLLIGWLFYAMAERKTREVKSNDLNGNRGTNTVHNDTSSQLSIKDSANHD